MGLYLNDAIFLGGRIFREGVPIVFSVFLPDFIQKKFYFRIIHSKRKMLTAISALNESSNSETSSDESNYEQDFQDEDFVAAYNSALSLYGNGKLTSAERSFRKLLNSDYFKQCGYDGKRPQPVAKKLQFNTLRYLGIILGKIILLWLTNYTQPFLPPPR